MTRPQSLDARASSGPQPMEAEGFDEYVLAAIRERLSAARTSSCWIFDERAISRTRSFRVGIIARTDPSSSVGFGCRLGVLERGAAFMTPQRRRVAGPELVGQNVVEAERPTAQGCLEIGSEPVVRPEGDDRRVRFVWVHGSEVIGHDAVLTLVADHRTLDPVPSCGHDQVDGRFEAEHRGVDDEMG